MPPDDGQDAVAVAFGVRQPLQQQDGARFGEDETVGVLVEGPAPSGSGQHALRGRRGVLARVEDDVAPPASTRSLSPMCRLRVAMCSASRPEEHAESTVNAGPRNPHVVGHPAGRHGVVVVGEAVRPLDGVRIGGDQLVVIGRQTHEHTGQRAVQGRGIDTGVLHRLPCGFQQEAMLRIGCGRLPVADAEEVGIEARDIVEERAPLGDRAPGGDPDLGGRSALRHPSVRAEQW